jgi:hypothetical protein
MVLRALLVQATPTAAQACPREGNPMPYRWPEDTDFALWEPFEKRFDILVTH